MIPARAKIRIQRSQWLYAVLIILACLGLLACLLVQSERVTRTNLQDSQWYGTTDAEIVGSWQFASAHANIGSLLDLARLSADAEEMDLLFAAQDLAPALALALPIMGLFAALAFASTNPRGADKACRRALALPHVILSIAIPAMIGLYLLWQSHRLEVPLLWSQAGRILIWLACIGVYFTTFLLIGGWISRRVGSVSKATWISLGLIVTLFMIQGSRDLVMRFDGSSLPPVPELPAEARLSLFRPSGQPHVTPDREAMVADYLSTVDAYSQSVYDLVSHRYSLERWWHVVSPHLLLNEVSDQLLQTQFASTVQLLAAPEGEDREPSLLASLTAVGPELIWLLWLGGLSGLVAWISERRQMIAS
ncbi:hypothetical protein KKG90_11805 [Candidatus Bipolaricaulota bacterium]|nr:hypothetical protein [Candidatus Bipolaricaulota bacterium]